MAGNARVRKTEPNGGAARPTWTGRAAPPQAASHDGGFTMTLISRRSLLLASALLTISPPAFAQTRDNAMTTLFKIVSVKDEVVIGLSADELAVFGGNDAGAVAKALISKGALTVWQYAVRKAANGDLEQAPRQKIGVIAHDSLRVEPYATPLKVLAHD